MTIEKIKSLLNKLPQRLKVEFALYCANEVKYLTKNKEAIQCISLVTRWLDNTVSVSSDDLYSAAGVAAHAAHAAAHATAYAANVAANAANAAANAAHAAAHAAHAAAHAAQANAAFNANAAFAAAHAAAHSAHAASYAAHAASYAAAANATANADYADYVSRHNKIIGEFYIYLKGMIKNLTELEQVLWGL